MYDIAVNAFASAFSRTGAGPEVGVIRGITVGAVGGVALGLAFKDKMHAIYFALCGATGFAIAFAVVISLDLHELAAGAIVGATGGLILGLASTKGRVVSSFLLCSTGIIWFASAFALRRILPEGDPQYSWDGWAGAVGGAIFGLTLALHYRMHDKLRSLDSSRAVLGQEQ
jgi:hypothetical protein